MDELPIQPEFVRRVNDLSEIVSEKCDGPECMDPQMVLACAASEGVPKAKEKLLRLRALTDAGASLDNEFALAWLTTIAPVEMVRLAACLKMQSILVQSIEETGIPVGTRERAIAALRSARSVDPGEKAVQAQVIAELEKARERNLTDPCEPTAIRIPETTQAR